MKQVYWPAVAVNGNSIFAVMIYGEFVPTMRSRLRGKEFKPAHGAGVVVVKPGGDAVGADVVIARKADQTLYDIGFGRQRAHFLMALAHA